MFISTVTQKLNTRSLIKLSAAFLLAFSLYLLQSCQSKEAKQASSPQQEEPAKTETAFEKTEIQTEENNPSVEASTKIETTDLTAETLHPKVSEPVSVKNNTEVQLSTTTESSKDDISGDYIYLTSEGNFVSSDQPQAFAYQAKNIKEEDTETGTSTFVENNQPADSNTQSETISAQEKNTEIQNIKEPSIPSIEKSSRNIEDSQETPDFSPEKPDTQSHIVINGVPVNAKQDFKEIKISDIQSIQVANQEDIKVNAPKPEVINVSEKIQQSNSDIVRLYYPNHSNYVYDALLISKNYPEQAQPLYVIDGTRIERTDLYMAIVRRLNPEDIDSISFIKGNAATPLYGNKASEGALVINSKSGNLLQNIIRESTGKSQKKSDKENAKPKSTATFVVKG
ncbi:TonB-dependent receptor plug domain-containing protein [Apibacter sp. HY039]|uniref:TonB-dependent receptor plug domain-containing protein n=1 Tax=Apibacter sp. HY039 TaxID=2501476 RepID=UPI000FEBF3B8|nr:TonB-dependent receptor plug domain-containing protein [Apibacter sp. HY039]